MMKRRILSTCGLAAIAVGSAPAMAQTTQASQDAPAAVGLNDIVVTAQRKAERLQDVPLTVSTVTSDEIVRAGVSNVQNLSNLVAGLSWGGQGSTAQPAIRGISTLISVAGSENPVALYVDGVYQPNSDVLSQEFADIDNIQVLKGPQGTLFGRNSNGGAILLSTRNPSTDARQAHFTVEPSLYDGAGPSRSATRIVARGFISIPLVKDLAGLSVSGAISHTPGYMVNDGTGKRDGVMTKRNVRAKLLVTPTDNTELVINGFYFKNDGNGLLLATPYKGLSVAAAYPGSVVPTLPYHVAYETLTNDIQANTAKQRSLSGKFTADFDAGTLTLASSYEKSQKFTPNTAIHFAQSDLASGCIAAFQCLFYRFQPISRSYSDELNFSSRNFGRFSFTGGLFYFNNAGSTFGAIQQPVVPPDGISIQRITFKTKSYAVYGQGTYELTDALKIIAGLRYTRDKVDDEKLPWDTDPTQFRVKRKFNSVTPRISVLYTVSPAVNLYATYSKGQKAGLSGVSNTAPGPAQYQQVDPEKLTAYEVGIKYGTGGLTANLSGFYYDYKNKQEQTFFGTDSVTVNTGKVRIYGLDFDGRARVTDKFSLNGSLSWIPVAKYLDFPNASGQSPVLTPFGFPSISFDASGYRLIRTPRISANGTIAYKDGPLDVSTTLSYSSSQFHDNTHVIRQGGYALLSAQAGYKFNDQLRVGVFGRNLTNNSYIVAGLTSGSAFAATWGQPREIGLSLDFTY